MERIRFSKKPLKELFDIKCKACNSTKVQLFYDDEYCAEQGWYEGEVELNGQFYLALKCMDCGQAKVVEVKRY